MKQAGKCVIWPANLNGAKARRDGRKLHKDVCVDSPKLGELETAAKALGLVFEAVLDKSRPGQWWERTGYLVVERRDRSKLQVMEQIAREVTRLRQTKK